MKNGKKINTSLKAGQVFETHADPHAHFISSKQLAVSGKVLCRCSPISCGCLEHNHDVNSTSRKGRKPSDPSMFYLFGPKKT